MPAAAPKPKAAAGKPARPGPKADDLAKRVRELEERVRQLESAAAAPAARPAPAWVPVAAPPPAPLPPPLANPPAPATPEPSWEQRLGANWLARAGVLLLAFGVVFFLRLAYDRGWVPIPGRFAIGCLGGLALWALGDALRGRRLDPAFAQVLAGGGAVILYVTLYCGYALHAYRAALHLPLAADLALLAACSVLLGLYAMWRDLPLLAGAAGGMATILLAPAGDFSVAGVLYATFLDTALMLASAWKRWPPVVLTAILAANVPILTGFGQHYQWMLLLACAAVANGAGIAASVLSRGERAVANIQAGLALALLALSTGLAFHAAHVPHAFGWATLALGLAGLALAFALRRVAPGLGAASAVLLMAWPIAQFQDSLWTPLWHGVLALAAVGLGAAVPRARAGTAATGVAGAAVGVLGFWSLDAARHPAGPLWLVVLAGVAVAAAGLANWLALRAAKPTRGAGQVTLATGLLATLLTLHAALTGWPVTVSWALVAVAAVVAGLQPRLAELRMAAFALFGVVLVRIFFVDLAGLGVVGRVVAFLLTGALLLVAAFLYARARKGPTAPPPVPPG